MEIQNKIHLVLGLGTTGIAVCGFLMKRGGKVIGVDDLPRSLLMPQVDAMPKTGISVFSTQESFPLDWRGVDRVILSPGVSLTHPMVEEARRRQIPIMGELELAAQFSKSPVVAITGTNGKSTTTELVGAMFKEAGRRVSVGGNLGTPWVSLIDQNNDPEWTVLEVSSFQLETIQSFHPKISVLLNITDDHFERHHNMENYVAAKSRIFMNQTEADFAVYHANDVHVLEALEGARSKKIPFSSTEHVKGITWESEKLLLSTILGSPQMYSLDEVALKGLHNIENMMAAIAVAELAGLTAPKIQRALENFRPLPHRLEFVRELNGVRYFDDSKGTNVGAVVMSLASFDEPVVLILGGKDKGGDYGVLRALVKNKVKALVLMGEATEKIRMALEGTTSIFEVGGMQEAVKEAQTQAQAGDVILLSPACSSFDMFRDYKHRGDEFQKWVRAL